MIQKKQIQDWIQIPEDKWLCIRFPVLDPKLLAVEPMKEKIGLWFYFVMTWVVYIWSLYEWDFQLPVINEYASTTLGDFGVYLLLLYTIHLCRTIVELWVARRLDVNTSVLSLQIHGCIPTLHYDIQSNNKKGALYTHVAGLSTAILACGVCSLNCDAVGTIITTCYMMYHCCIFFSGSIARRIACVLLNYKPCSVWAHIKVLATSTDECEMFRHCTYLLYHTLTAGYSLAWIFALLVRPAHSFVEVFL